MADEPEVAQPQKGPNKTLIFVVLAVIIVLCGAVLAGGVWWMKSRSTPEDIIEASEIASNEDDTNQPLTTKALDSFVVNLAPPDDSTFLSLVITLAYTDNEKNVEFSKELEARQAQLRHSINMILSSKKKREISTVEGKERVNREIMTTVNSILTKGKVEAIYFDKFVLQGQ